MNFRFFPLFAASALMILASCRKDEAVLDTLPPTITWISPGEGAVFSAGQDIELALRIEENDELHDWRIELRRLSDNALLAERTGHEHTSVLDVSATISASVSQPTPCELVAVADDHSGNEARSTRAIAIEP
jgi:hypothetical protein